MSQVLSLFQETLPPHYPSWSYPRTDVSARLHSRPKLRLLRRYRAVQCSIKESWEAEEKQQTVGFKAKVYDEDRLNAFPHVQTLTKFPKESLLGKVVLVRFDYNLLLEKALDSNILSIDKSLLTITYLYGAGAKVLLVSSWGRPSDSKSCRSTSTVADYLSSLLQLKVVPTNWISDCALSKVEEFQKADILLVENILKCKEELANCSVFARKLSSGVDVFVNDTFSLSHKILASTVGVSRYCYASVAGFCFEEELSRVLETIKTTKQPYIAIIGGGNLLDKAVALHLLASKCDGLVFVGVMGFQIMHALGLPVPLSYLEHGAVKDSVKLIQLARERNIPILLPKDFWCVNLSKKLNIFPACEILDDFVSLSDSSFGALSEARRCENIELIARSSIRREVTTGCAYRVWWDPVDLGPVSLEEISSLLTNCKKILWIGSVKSISSGEDAQGASKLAAMLSNLCRRGCNVTVVGKAACKAITRTSMCISAYSLQENASVMWDFLKGRMLPGLAALDRAYPFEIDWNTTFYNPAQPLVVDIGSGNGLFLLGMARRQKDTNFLGLEINKKLVRRCLDSAHQSGLKNGYFIATNATSTFRSIISSYPGKLIFVSIQCPIPDFNKPEHRWRMLQRSLVEAVVDLLETHGKVFLQSDVESVAVRMRDQFIMYGKGKLVLKENDDDLKANREGWLEDNPFDVRSDWEQHVLNRGDPMYRLMLSRID
ncbi:hypothetical protein GIB67_000253 [Kingdonia uniflora]|uniref:Phosphoglycerate kinase n=1 Tax=Kingdonia uniflora TaxID=39325 RepID=A0A7J7LC60_9MAGN|nr:hypothetical protein GIB67_000253 [Kingdonia uniflora]